MKQPRSLTATGFAILIQFALKPWSAHELAQQRDRYFRCMWPRAQTRIYGEVTVLAVQGFAEAECTSVGKRGRTVYRITPDGREAIRAWLGAPVGRFSLEFEALLRVFMASLGSKEERLATLRQVAADAEVMRVLADGIRQEYLEGRAPFQEQTYVRALVVDFLAHFQHAVAAWADRTLAEVATGEDLTPEGKHEKALQQLQSLPLGSEHSSARG